MTKDEYLERVNKNQEITGFGMEVTMHMPCPFCGAPDFMVYLVLETEIAAKRGAVCKECKRGARALFDHSQGGVQFEFVQTEGPDPDVEGVIMPRRDSTPPHDDGENRRACIRGS